jgi:hypothetical protein
MTVFAENVRSTVARFGRLCSLDEIARQYPPHRWSAVAKALNDMAGAGEVDRVAEGVRVSYRVPPKPTPRTGPKVAHAGPTPAAESRLGAVLAAGDPPATLGRSRPAGCVGLVVELDLDGGIGSVELFDTDPTAGHLPKRRFTVRDRTLQVELGRLVMQARWLAEQGEEDHGDA